MLFIEMYLTIRHIFGTNFTLFLASLGNYETYLERYETASKAYEIYQNINIYTGDNNI